MTQWPLSHQPRNFGKRTLNTRGHPQEVHVQRDEHGAALFFIAHIQDVTERKRAESVLQENEEKFRIAFENAPMGMSIIGPHGQYLDVNPALCRMFGYSKKDLLTGTINRITHHDDIERGNAWIRRMISGDTSEPEFEKRYIHKDGQIVWGLVRAEWVRSTDGSPKMSVVHVLDITERKRAEQELLDRERQLRDAHEIANMGHWQHELFNNGVTWADGIYRILEHASPATIPSHDLFLERVHPDDHPIVFEAHLSAIESQVPTDIDLRLLMPDSRIKHVRRITRKETSESGRALRIVGILQDVSTIRGAEEERTKLEAQPHQAQKMEAIGYLAGGIAHDFNNLLTVMGGNASLALLDAERTLGASESIREILKSVESAAELTRQLLAFSRKQCQPKPYGTFSSPSILRRGRAPGLGLPWCMAPYTKTEEPSKFIRIAQPQSARGSCHNGCHHARHERKSLFGASPAASSKHSSAIHFGLHTDSHRSSRCPRPRSSISSEALHVPRAYVARSRAARSLSPPTLRLTICVLMRSEYDLYIAFSNRPAGWNLSTESVQARRQLP